MRDIDREIGIGSFPEDAADDMAAVERNRRIAERLLRADETEETLQVLREAPDGPPVRRGETREQTLRALERRAREERESLRMLASGGSLDYGALDRAMGLQRGMR